MLKRSLFSLVVLTLSACSGTPSAAPPCADDTFCPTGSFCDRATGKCSPTPPDFAVTIASANPVTAGKTLKLATTSPGGVTWSVQEASGGTIDADGTYHSPATAGVYHVIATSTADSSKSATVAITVVPLADATVTLVANVTRGKAGLTASAPAQAGSSYAWAISSPGLITAGETNDLVTFTAPADSSASVTLTATVTNTAGDPATAFATSNVVDAVLPAVVLAPASVTTNQAGYTASVSVPQPNVTYAWSSANANITSPTSGTSIQFTGGSSIGPYTLTATGVNVAGDAVDGTKTGSVGPVITAPASVSPGVTYTASVPAGSSNYDWSATSPNVTILTGGGTRSITFTASATPAGPVTLSVTVTAASGAGTGKKTLTFVPLDPTVLVTTAGGVATTNLSQGVTYTASVGAGYSQYTWSAPNSNLTILTGAGTRSITFTAPAPSGSAFTLSVTIENSLGDTAPGTKTLNFVPLDPTITVTKAGGGPTSSISQGVTYTATVGTSPTQYSQYTWSVANGNLSILSGAGTSSITFRASSPSGSAFTLTTTIKNSLNDTASSTKTLAFVPLDPTITVTKAGGTVVASISQGVVYTATALATAGSTYDWSATTANLTIVSGGGTNAITFEAPAPSDNPFALSVQVTNSLSDVATASNTVTFVALDPAITIRTVTDVVTTDISQGVTYTASVTSGYNSYDWTTTTGNVTLLGNPSNSSVSFKVPNPPGGNALTLRVTISNSLGDSATGTSSPTFYLLDGTVTVANTIVTRGKTGLAASVQDHGARATYDWATYSNGVAVTAGEFPNEITFSPTSTNAVASLECLVTNPLGDTVRGNVALSVVDPPQLSGIELTSYVLDGRASPAAAVSYADRNGVLAYDWSLQPNTIIGNTAQPLTGISFTGLNGVLSVSARNQANDSTPPLTVDLTTNPISHGPTGAMLIAGKTGGPGYMDGSGTTARVSPAGFAADLNGGFILGQNSANEVSLAKITSSAGGWSVSRFAAGTNGTVPYVAISPISATSFFAADYGGSYRYDYNTTTWTSTNLGLIGAGPNGLSAGLLASGDVDPNTFYFAKGYAVYKASYGSSPNWSYVLIAGNPSSSGYAEAPVGPGTDARFNYITGLVALDANTVLVSDQSNQAIRQLHFNSTGAQWEVTTIAGGAPNTCAYVDGAGNVARFCYPLGLARFDASTVYVADASNNAVRKLVKSGGTWTTSTLARFTYSGQFTEASINYPMALAVDQAKAHLAIAQSTGNVISLDLSTLAATSLVGKSIAYLGDRDAPNGPGLAVRFNPAQGLAAADPSTVYVVEYYTLRQLKLVGGVWSSTTVVNFNWPTVLYSVGVLDANNLLLGMSTYDNPSGTYQAALQLLTYSGGAWNPTTLAGGGAFQGSVVPGCLGVADQDTVFLCNSNYSTGAVYRVTRADPSWSVETLPGLPWELVQAGVGAIAVVSPYEVYVTNRYSGTVTHLSTPPPLATPAWTSSDLVLPVLTGNNASVGLVATDANHLFQTDANNGLVYAHTSSGPAGPWTTTTYGMPGQRAVVPGPLPTPQNSVTSLRFNAPSSLARLPGAPGLEFVLLDRNEAALVHLALAARAPVALGAAGSFAILAQTGVTNAPNSTVTGDVGLSPALAANITGFSLVPDSSNVFYTSDQVFSPWRVYTPDNATPTPSNLTAAVGAMQAAYNDAAARTAPEFSEVGGGNIGGQTLAPGLYKWTTGVSIPQRAYLQGGPNDVWIFQIAGNLAVSSYMSFVSVSGGATAKNVFWQVGGTVDLLTNSHLEGIVLGKSSIGLANGASLTGRAMAQTSVTLDHAFIYPPQ